MADQDPKKILPTKSQPLLEGRDYYFNSQGLMVLTKDYLLRRGYCCESGCTNCPYGFKGKTTS